MLEHHLGERFGGIARDITAADAASHGKGMSKARCESQGRAWDYRKGQENTLVSTGADTKKTLRGEAAHSRLVIFVSLRMTTSAVAPLSPMLLQ